MGKIVEWRREVHVSVGNWRRKRRFVEGSEVERGLKGVVRDGVWRELRCVVIGSSR